MNRRQLTRAGHRLYGWGWQTHLARAVGVTDRTMRRWVAGDAPIPPPAALAISLLVESYNRGLEALAEAVAKPQRRAKKGVGIPLRAPLRASRRRS